MPLPFARVARWAAPAVVAALLLLLPGTATARADVTRPPQVPPAPAVPYPGLDLVAAESALQTGPVYRAPGAPAQYDEARVRPLLAPGTRILLAPYTPLDYGSGRLADDVTTPLRDWARDRDLKVVLVVGLRVRVLSSGAIGPSTLDGVRALLAHHDVTADLVLALENLRSGLEHLADPPAHPGPPDPAERDAVLAGLRASRIYGGVADGPWVDKALPGGAVRVAALPALAPGAPDPEMLPALRAAFPGEVVVVLRDRWIEAAGPDVETGSARDYVLGRYADFLAQRQVEPKAEIRLLLERLALLRSGEPFGRPQPAGVRADDLAARWTPWALGAAALVLGGGSLVLAAVRTRRRSEAATAQVRRGRALAVAELAELDAAFLGSDEQASAPVARLRAEAAERTATAYALLEHARDPGEIDAVQAAIAQARALADRARAGAR